MTVMLFVVFVIVYLFIVNWMQIHTFLTALLKPKRSISIIEDVGITSTVKKKTGLTLKRIIIFESEKLFGMMPSIPVYPEMILSRRLYESFNRDELEWVVLHEAGHCVLWHNAKCATAQGIILLLGVYLLGTQHITHPMLSALLFAIPFGLIAIQGMRYFEYEADSYSIMRVDNPNGVITAQRKLVKSYDRKLRWFYGERSVFRKLLFWNILPSERIGMAQKRLAARSKQL